MKRYFVLITVFFLTVYSSLATDVLNFAGGTITTPVTWNAYDIIYINSSITISAGGSLNIAPNTTGGNAGALLPVYVIFTGTYGITVSPGNAAFNVNGTAARNITFNSDRNTNYTFDAGETWRNIYFSQSTGTSLIEYAVFERGTGSTVYGGGLRIIATNVTVKNSTVRHCSASNGGGIYVQPYPAIGGVASLESLKIYNNSSSTLGGGVYVYDNVNFTGCEIYNNTAPNGAGIYFRATGSISNSKIYNQTAGHGIYSNLGDASGYITNCIISNNLVGIRFFQNRNVVNCDIVNNGTGVASASATAPKLVNTVLWNTTLEYSIEAGAQLELGYCAIKGGLTGGVGQIDGGGNKTLSSTNGADTGPNFVDSSSDFHINSWVSPLVDGGTSSYSSLSIPGSDIEGRAFLVTKDIGSYEFLYYVWTGGASTTDWTTSSNWVGSPSSVPTTINENKVIIPSGLAYYPTASSLTLQNRSSLTVQPGAGLTVTGSTSVGSNCTFTLKSNSTGSANFITGSSVSGTFNTELFILGGGGPDFNWHYVTTPVNGIGKSVLTSSIGNTNNLLNFDESKVVTNKMEGWNWHDGHDGSTIFTTLRSDYGYNVFVYNDQTAVFSGSILDGSNDYTNASITCGSLGASLSGWNLVGNPFTSSIDINELSLGESVGSVVYFTKANSFSSYDVITHESINEATNIISPLQGFFVHVTEGFDQYVIIPASSRVYSQQPLLKGGSSKNKEKGGSTHPILKMNLTDETPLSDETLIYFFNDATQNVDLKYDGYKMLSNNSSRPQIYSTVNTIDYSMNGLPFPSNITVVPLKLRIGEAKDYTINVMKLDNLTDYDVTLIHGTNRIDLKANPSYTFPGTVGTITDMSIEFALTVPTDINTTKQDQTSVWYSNESLYIKTALAGFENNSSLVIYDVNGRVVLNKSNLRFGKGEIVEVPVSLPGGFYITSLKNKNQIQSNKIVISH